jgi:plasmid stabilization system protein ParE
MTNLITLLLVTLSSQAPVDGGSTRSVADAKSEFKRWVDFYTQQAVEYRISVGDRAQHPLELQRTPVLEYSNPVRTTDQHGTVYVWTREGRPEAIGSIWSTVESEEAAARDERHVSHEFQSLSDEPLQGRHPEWMGQKGLVPEWKTGQPGIEWKRLSSDAGVLKMSAARLREMKRLVAAFSARIIESNAETSSDLRLLSKPLIRYASPSAGVVDGGLFAFVQATDPELLLLIELRDSDNGPQWYHAAARFTNRPLKLLHDDQTVWSCGEGQAFAGDQPYFLYWGVVRHRIKLGR